MVATPVVRVFPENGQAADSYGRLFTDGAKESALITGDSGVVLEDLPNSVFQTCVTSPPYWSLRDYNIDGQIGLETSVTDYLEDFCEKMAQP